MSETKDSKTTQLLLEGDLTVKRAPELRDLFMESLSSAQHVVVAFGEVRSLDLSWLQLMCSAHRFAIVRGKSMELADPDNDYFVRIRNASGFKAGRKCRFNLERECLMAEEKQC